VAVLILAIATLIFRFLLMWLLSWLIATPVRGVRAALNRVAHGDLRGDLVAFDGTELAELQSGFHAMVNGLREREHVRDLFGRHVGRDVAAAAERERPELGGEQRHVAVVRRYRRLDPVGDQAAGRRDCARVQPVLRGDRR
jgi:adenylate cyclase